MIGIAEDDLGLDIVAQLVHVHGLDASERAHGHEYRSLDGAVVGGDHAGTRLRSVGGGDYFIVHSQGRTS